MASWNTDSAISVKAANQKILLQVQFLQSLAHNRRMIADLKLQGFCLAVQNVVQGLHIASDGVLGGSYILQNIICCNIFRINHTSNIQAVNNIVVGQTVYLRYQLGI